MEWQWAQDSPAAHAQESLPAWPGRSQPPQGALRASQAWPTCLKLQSLTAHCWARRGPASSISTQTRGEERGDIGYFWGSPWDTQKCFQSCCEDVCQCTEYHFSCALMRNEACTWSTSRSLLIVLTRCPVQGTQQGCRRLNTSVVARAEQAGKQASQAVRSVESAGKGAASVAYRSLPHQVSLLPQYHAHLAKRKVHASMLSQEAPGCILSTVKKQCISFIAMKALPFRVLRIHV